MAGCDVDSCDRPASGAGLCHWHYQRARKGQPLDTPHRVRTGTACEVTGCESPHYCRGLCIMHYDRQRTKGDVGPVDSFRAPRGEGSIEANGYRVVRRPDHPLARAQGKVFEHRVVLFDAIGPGAHPCHWCGITVAWDPAEGVARLVADHLDEDRLNNTPENLVPSCIPCNTHRESVVA